LLSEKHFALICLTQQPKQLTHLFQINITAADNRPHALTLHIDFFMQNRGDCQCAGGFNDDFVAALTIYDMTKAAALSFSPLALL